MIPIKSEPFKEAAMPHGTTTMERIDRMIAGAHCRMGEIYGVMPKPFSGIKIANFETPVEQFRSCLLNLAGDPLVFNALVHLASRGIFVRIKGQWGEWIAWTHTGDVEIRCDIGIQRVRAFFEIEEEKST